MDFLKQIAFYPLNVSEYSLRNDSYVSYLSECRSADSWPLLRMTHSEQDLKTPF